MPGIDSYTKLCIVSGPSVDNNTDFYDSSASDHTITANGNVHHDTDEAVFGTSSIKSDGNGDYLSIPYSADFDFGTGDFTIDLQAMCADGNSGYLLRHGFQVDEDEYGELTLEILSPGFVAFFIVLEKDSTYYEVSLESTTYVDDGNFHHIEISKSSTTYRMFIDGDLEDSTTVTIPSINDYATSNGVAIGSSSGNSPFLNGYLDQIRISKGIARHTASFTPPSESYDSKILAYGDTDTPVPEISTTANNQIFAWCDIDSPMASFHGVGNNPILAYVDIDAPAISMMTAEMAIAFGVISPPLSVINGTASFPIFTWFDYDSPRVEMSSAMSSQQFLWGNFTSPRPVLFSDYGPDSRVNSKAPQITATCSMSYPVYAGVETPKVAINSSMVAVTGMSVAITPRRAKLTSRIPKTNSYEVITYRR